MTIQSRFRRRWMSWWPVEQNWAFRCGVSRRRQGGRYGGRGGPASRRDRPSQPGTVFYNFPLARGRCRPWSTRRWTGAFGYDTPVVELWPEFGAHGKEGVTVATYLTHTAGCRHSPSSPTTSDISTWDTMIRALEDAEFWWEPGTKTAITLTPSDICAGEIVRRSTGRRSPRCFRKGSLRRWDSLTSSSLGCRGQARVFGDAGRCAE